MTEENPDSTELLGWFWPPEDETKKLPGRLTTAADASMMLDVINQPKSSEQASQQVVFLVPDATGLPWTLPGPPSRLVGVVSGTSISGSRVQDAPITLDDCYCRTSGSWPQPSHLSFIVNAAYIGAALQPDETLLSSGVSCRAEGIEGWLNPGGPRRSNDNFGRPVHVLATTAEFDNIGPAKVEMAVVSGFSRERGNVLEIRDSGYLTLQPEAAVDWDCLRECLYKLQRLIRFALNAPCHITQVVADANGSSIEVVERRMRGGTKRPYRPGRVRWEALFTADPSEKAVVRSPKDVLRRWLETPREVEGALLRLDALMASDQHVDSQVASICGAAELWYAKILGEDRPPVTNVRPLSTAAKKTLDRILQDHGWSRIQRKRVRQVLDPPNELSTSEKVRRTFDPIERDVLEVPENRKCEISTGLLALRHPLSHGGVASEMPLRDMYALVRKAGAILKLRVLEYLGVDWRAVAKYNKTIRWDLGLGEDQSHALPYPADETPEHSEERPDENR